MLATRCRTPPLYDLVKGFCFSTRGCGRLPYRELVPLLDPDGPYSRTAASAYYEGFMCQFERSAFLPMYSPFCWLAARLGMGYGLCRMRFARLIVDSLNGLPLSRSYLRFSTARTLRSASSFCRLSSFCRSKSKLLKQAFICSVARSQPRITPHVLSVFVRVSLLCRVSAMCLVTASRPPISTAFFSAAASGSVEAVYC